MIARRYSDANHYQEKDGKLIPLPAAFKETRPGGISVDVLWADGGTKPGAQKDALVAAAAVAVAEGHEIRGWFAARVKLVLDKAPTAHQVLHSPTPTNANHADIMAKPFMRFDEKWSAEDKKDAVRVIAKDLAEVFGEHGGHLQKPDAPVSSSDSETKSPKTQ